MEPDIGEEEEEVVVNIRQTMTREQVVESILQQTDLSIRGRNK